MEIPAQLIIGGSPEERIQEAQKLAKPFFSQPIDLKKPPVDFLMIQSTNSIGINQVRALKKFLSLKPYQAQIKIGLIAEAEKLTLPAQNSLLKTIEEPPENSLIILLANQSVDLLPTIISRVKIIRLPAKSQIFLADEEIKELGQILKRLLSLRVGERIKLSLDLAKDKHQALKLTESLLYLWRHYLLTKTGVKKKRPQFINQLGLGQIEKAIKNTEQVRKMLVANVNFHLAIENLFLSYPHLS